MPEVRRYGNLKVGTEALPGVRKTSAETETSAGVGLANAQEQTAEQLGRLSGTVATLATRQVAEMEAKERERADNVALLDAETKLGQWENKRLYDPDTGAFTLRGKDALPLPETVGGEFRQVAGELEAGLNPRQRAMFQRVKANREQNLDANLRRHVFGETQRYDAQTMQATEENAAESAAANAADPRRVGQELERGIAAIRDTGPSLGMGPEAITQRVNNFTTKTHLGVIQRLVDDKDVMRARVYFEEKGDEITDPQVRAHVTGLLKVGTEQAAALKAADAIIGAGGTRREQLAKAKDLDPDIRERVEQRIEHEAAVKKTEEREQEETLLDGVYARIKRSGGELRLTPTEENRLGRHLPALEAYALREAKGLPAETDQAVYYMLKEAATTDPAAFLETNLLTFKNKLSDSDFQELTGLRGAIRSGNKTAANKVLDDWRTERDVVTSALTRAGLDASPKDSDTAGKQRVAQFSSLVAEEARRVQGITGKKIPNEDLEAIADRLLAKQITDKGWFYSSSKSLGAATVKDIPAAELKLIYQSLEGDHQPATPEMALQIWLRRQAQMKGGQ